MKPDLKYLFLLGTIIFLNSCSVLKPPVGKAAEIEDLGISWFIEEEVRDLDKIKVDSIMNSILDRFNNQHHQFLVHRASRGDEKSMHFNYDRGRFVKKGGVVAGYVLTLIGLTACPVLIANATDGNFFLIFWVIPKDHIDATVTLSPDITMFPNSRRKLYAFCGTWFKNPQKRQKMLNERLEKKIWDELLKFEQHIIRERKKNKITHT